MALYSLLKLVALCALFQEAAAFAEVPPSDKDGGALGATRSSKSWHTIFDADYPDIPGDNKITLTVNPQGGYDGAFIEAAKRMAEIKGNNIIVVKDGPATAWLKNAPNPEVGYVVGRDNHRVLAYY
jgi:hypothetical protein